MAVNLLHKLPLTYSENGIQYYTRNNKQVNSGKNLTKSNNHQINIMSNNKGLSDVNRINEVNISNKIMTQETLEEAAKRLYPLRNTFLERFKDLEQKIFIEGAKWQKQTADEFAIGFAEWFIDSEGKPKGEWSIKELLEIYKKEISNL